MRIGKVRMYDVYGLGAYQANPKLEGLPLRLVSHGRRVDTATNIAQLSGKAALGYAQASDMKCIAWQTL
jgi:hypothetical protein